MMAKEWRLTSTGETMRDQTSGKKGFFTISELLKNVSKFFSILMHPPRPVPARVLVPVKKAPQAKRDW